MEVQNQDLRTISALAIDQRVEEMNRDNQKLIYEVPGVSPLTPPKKRERSKYNEVQLQEAVKLAEIVGVPAAALKSGVGEATIYKYAASVGRTISFIKRGANAPQMPRRRYSSFALRQAFERGVMWHKNTGVALRTCITRAAGEAKINANYLWALYCNRDPVLGFGGPQ